MSMNKVCRFLTLFWTGFCGENFSSNERTIVRFLMFRVSRFPAEMKTAHFCPNKTSRCWRVELNIQNEKKVHTPRKNRNKRQTNSSALFKTSSNLFIKNATSKSSNLNTIKSFCEIKFEHCLIITAYVFWGRFRWSSSWIVLLSLTHSLSRFLHPCACAVLLMIGKMVIKSTLEQNSLVKIFPHSARAGLSFHCVIYSSRWVIIKLLSEVIAKICLLLMWL